MIEKEHPKSPVLGDEAPVQLWIQKKNKKVTPRLLPFFSSSICSVLILFVTGSIVLPQRCDSYD